MDRIDTLKLFVRVAEAGSFSKGARQAEVSQSTASKQISALERRLGVQLVRRTSRGLALTAAGEQYRDEALRLVEGFEALEAAVVEKQRSPAGRVRVAAPLSFASGHLIPQLGAFLVRHPGLSIDFATSQRLVDLVEEYVDVAIRVGELQDSSLRARRVGTAEAVVVASSDYLAARGEPRTLGDLEGHFCIASMLGGRPFPWRLQGDDAVSFNPTGPLRSDEAELTRAAVSAGLGIAYAASWLFREEIATGAVRRLLPDHQGICVPISSVWSGDRALPRRAAVFIDFVAEVCAAEPTLRIR